jgi:hypothetical protein
MLKSPSLARFPSSGKVVGEGDGESDEEGGAMSECHSLSIQREYKIINAPTSVTKKLSSFKVH